MQISVPGFNNNSGIDTTKLIQDLVEAERQPLVRVENNIQEAQEEMAIWRRLDSHMSSLQDSAKKLYGFNNPFNERNAESSHPSIASAQSNRGASIGDYAIYVKQVASADRWLSDNISDDYAPPKGEYIINVGEDDQVVFQFIGNNLEELVDTINIQGKNLIKASIIKQGAQDDAFVLLLESLTLGDSGKLVLEEAAKEFGKEVKLIGIDNSKNSIQIALDNSYISSFLSDESLFSFTPIPPNEKEEKPLPKYLLLQPGAAGTIQLSSSQYNQLLSKPSATIRIELYPQYYTPESQEEGENSLLVELDTAKVLGALPQTLIEDLNQIAANEEINSEKTETSAQNEADAALDDAVDTLDSTTEEANAAASAENNDMASKKLPLLFDATLQNKFTMATKDIENQKPIEISLKASDLIIDNPNSNNKTVSFILANPFVDYSLVVNDVRLQENITSDGLVPLKPLNKAQNAIVEFNGIDLERDTNAITDIIPGTNLTLKRANPEQVVDITVSSNTEIIKDDIITFVGSYNQLMQSLVVYTSTDLTDLEDMQFPSEEDRTYAETNLGKLQGDFGLTRMMTDLQNIATDEYNNDLNSSITSLRAIGIAPNLADNTATLATNKYLDIDEDTLDRTIAEFPDAIAKLFGSDINNDIIIDYGVAFKVSEEVNPYAQTNGVIAQKESTLKNRIKRDETTADRYAVRLERYEQELRRKFGNMEQTVNQLNSATNTLNSLTQQNNNNRR